MPRSLVSLPYEVLSCITASLSSRDVDSLSQTCQALQYLVVHADPEQLKSDEMASSRRRRYLHEERRHHAMRRPRGPGGRFLTVDEVAESESNSKPPLSASQSGSLSSRWIAHLRSNSPLLYPSKVLRRSRTVLPMIIGNKVVDSCPDSGSEENIMVVELAQSLSLAIDTGEEYLREFRIANGNIVTAIGRVQTFCTFAKEKGVEIMSTFFVMKTLAFDLIMGMGFLDSTETLTKHKSRLEKRPLGRPMPQVLALGNPRRRLHCRAYDKPVLANADTGSEMNLLSLNYVQARALAMQKLDTGEAQVQLADGSSTYLAGKLTVPIFFKTPDVKVFTPTFYVMKDLSCSVLLGADFLDEIGAFETYRNSIVIEPDALEYAEISTILWFDTLEKFISHRGRFHTLAPEALSAHEEVCVDKPLPKGAVDRVKNFLHMKDQVKDRGLPLTSMMPSFEARMDERDARENHRRELAQNEILKMTSGPAKERALLEEGLRVAEFAARKRLLLQARSSASSGNLNAGSLIREESAERARVSD